MLKNLLIFNKDNKKMDLSQNYSQIEVSGLKQNELESRALIRTASGLNFIKEHWEDNLNDLPEIGRAHV